MPYSRWSGWWAWVPTVQWVPCLTAKSQSCHIPNVAMYWSNPSFSLPCADHKGSNPADGGFQASRWVWLRGSIDRRLKNGKKGEAGVAPCSFLPHRVSGQLLHLLPPFILPSIIWDHGGLLFITCQSWELAFLYVKAYPLWQEKNNHRNQDAQTAPHFPLLILFLSSCPWNPPVSVPGFSVGELLLVSPRPLSAWLSSWTYGWKNKTSANKVSLAS